MQDKQCSLSWYRLIVFESVLIIIINNKIFITLSMYLAQRANWGHLLLTSQNEWTNECMNERYSSGQFCFHTTTCVFRFKYVKCNINIPVTNPQSGNSCLSRHHPDTTTITPLFISLFGSGARFSKVFGPVKPFLDYLYLKTAETSCMKGTSLHL